MNPLRALEQHGQSFWLDSLCHDAISGGELQSLIERDGLKGMTSNPATFEKAVRGNRDYQRFAQSLRPPNVSTQEIYEILAVQQIRRAAHRLLPVYAKTAGRDGYAALQLSPHLAYDTEGTILEARRLWRTVDYDNLMLRVPATDQGIAALRRLIAEGINVDATLIFSAKRYEQVADAYMAGLEQLAAAGSDLSRMAGVASVFISRVDTEIDTQLITRHLQTRRKAEQRLIERLLGRVTVANARLVYQRHRELFGSERWRALERAGARAQRLLWAGTGPENPNYRDVMYVEALIGADTVNSMSPETVECFRDHGRPRNSLAAHLEESHRILASLEPLGISLQQSTERLLDQGVRLLEEAFVSLFDALRSDTLTADTEHRPYMNATRERNRGERNR